MDRHARTRLAIELDLPARLRLINVEVLRCEVMEHSGAGENKFVLFLATASSASYPALRLSMCSPQQLSDHPRKYPITDKT
ncbi:MAG: hypothetical protein V4844_22250 [Pseudomonadota bacterium]